MLPWPVIISSSKRLGPWKATGNAMDPGLPIRALAPKGPLPGLKGPLAASAPASDAG